MYKYLLGLLLLMSAGVVDAVPADNYTAKMTLGGMSMTVACMDNKMRVENPSIKGIVFINLPDARKSITISNDTKSYMEQPLRQETPSPCDKNATMEKKKTDNETVNDHPCTRYNVTFHIKDRPKARYEGVIWEADDLGGLIIKYEVKPIDPKRKGKASTVKMELTDIKVGTADKSMFEVPKTYKRVSSMHDLIGADVDTTPPADGQQPDADTPREQHNDEVYE
ncbi:conserved hypothetical protein, secreted [Candidatus Magnetobacterium bavaricum]|uniref:Secreted protein n=1 Tax=Candidatus Magnetobacterium bavaricum TaxID=29290 RepID=A0A0F3GYP9_9BACT|nr:conserved hypothetical protein, secreted [Candidatus Magnetobacterium bavaricum]